MHHERCSAAWTWWVNVGSLFLARLRLKSGKQYLIIAQKKWGWRHLMMFWWPNACHSRRGLYEHFLRTAVKNKAGSMRISESSRLFVSWTSALCINLNPSFWAPWTVAIFIPSNREKRGADRKQETNANISLFSVFHARIGKCSTYSLWELLTRLNVCNRRNARARFLLRCVHEWKSWVWRGMLRAHHSPWHDAD